MSKFLATLVFLFSFSPVVYAVDSSFGEPLETDIIIAVRSEGHVKAQSEIQIKRLYSKLASNIYGSQLNDVFLQLRTLKKHSTAKIPK